MLVNDCSWDSDMEGAIIGDLCRLSMRASIEVVMKATITKFRYDLQCSDCIYKRVQKWPQSFTWTLYLT